MTCRLVQVTDIDIECRQPIDSVAFSALAKLDFKNGIDERLFKHAC